MNWIKPNYIRSAKLYVLHTFQCIFSIQSIIKYDFNKKILIQLFLTYLWYKLFIQVHLYIVIICIYYGDQFIHNLWSLSKINIKQIKITHFKQYYKIASNHI